MANRGQTRGETQHGGPRPDAELRRLRRAVEASGEVIFMTDPTGVFTYVNPAFERLYGHSAAEVVGRATPRILKGGQLSPDQYAEFWARLLARETLQAEFLNLAHDGRSVIVESAVNPIVDDQGDLVGYLAIQRDVTARKDTERRLAQWADIFDHTTVGVSVALGLDDRVAFVNPAYARMHGYSAEELAGVPIAQFYPPDQRESIPARIRAAAVAGHLTFEAVHQRKDGTTFPVTADLVTVRDAGGGIRYRISTVLDRTEHAQSEQRYRTLYASMREGVAIHELVRDERGEAIDYRILDVNPAFAHHTGLETSMAVRTLASVLYGTVAAPFLEAYRRVVETRQPTEFEAEIEPLGKVFQVSAFATGPDGFATVFEDVSERRRLEEQFRQAQKMEAIGRLAGGIAHDFNNLLTAILGYADLLAEQDLPEQARADLAEVKKAGDAAAALTRQLLAFSRKQVMRPEVVDLNTIVHDIDAMLRRVIGEDVTLVTVPAPGLWPLCCDPGQIRQVLLNLAVNARDAMPSGGTLVIETSNVTIGAKGPLPGDPPPGRYVRLVVTDTGCGIPADVKARLFEPFFTTKEKGKGTGLGLSTVYGIVKQSAGFITVESEVGRGTSFRMLLPRGVEEVADKAGVATGGDRAGSASETVLVVEDQHPVRALMCKVLRGLGYRVIEASDAETALALARGHDGAIHLLLTDLLLGDINGPELAQRLIGERPEVRVLYVSGYADPSTLFGALSSRVDFLHKPFTPDVLADKVRDVLDRS